MIPGKQVGVAVDKVDESYARHLGFQICARLTLSFGGTCPIDTLTVGRLRLRSNAETEWHRQTWARALRKFRPGAL